MLYHYIVFLDLFFFFFLFSQLYLAKIHYFMYSFIELTFLYYIFIFMHHFK